MIDKYKPDCRVCPHKSNIPGNAHVSCKHKIIAPLWEFPLSKLFAVAGGLPPMSAKVDIRGAEVEIVTFNQFGINGGWASWPYNFDPRWLEVCWLWVADHMREGESNAEDGVREM